MDDLFFEPEYPPRHYAVLSLGVIPGLGALALALSNNWGPRALALSAVLALALPVALRANHVRRVVFGEKLVVVRYLLHDRYFNYAEVVRVDCDAVTTLRGRIRIGAWVNRRAFLDVLAAQRERGAFRETEFAPGLFDGSAS